MTRNREGGESRRRKYGSKKASPKEKQFKTESGFEKGAEIAMPNKGAGAEWQRVQREASHFSRSHQAGDVE